MKYCVVDDKVEFYKYKKDGKYYFNEIMDGTPVEQPPVELIERLEGKIFSNYTEAKQYIEAGCPKSEIEILRETVDALVVASLEV